MTKIPLTHRLWAKICAYFLLAVCGAGLAVSIIGAAAASAANVYGRTFAELRDQAFCSACFSIAGRASAAAFQLPDSESALETLCEGRNVRLSVRDKSGKLVYTNAVSSRSSLDYSFVVDENGSCSSLPFYKSGPIPDDNGVETTQEVRLVTVHVLEDLADARDDFFVIARLLHILYDLRYVLWLMAFGFLIACTALFIFLLCAAGHRPGLEQPVLNLADRIPFDLFCLLVWSLAGILSMFGTLFVMGLSDLRFFGVFICAIFYILAILTLVGGCQSLAARIKVTGWGFIKQTLCWRVLRWCWHLFAGLCHGFAAFVRGLPLIWKSVCVLGALCLMEFFSLATAVSASEVFSLWFLTRLVLVPLILAVMLLLQRILAGGQALAGGDLSYRISTRYMRGNLRRHAENLNSISAGMARAVEQQLKSERMKTELITNVSHDIKTPLTSIINYADLLDREPDGSPRTREYIHTIHKHAERLKKLLDDLVEAARASSGSIEVHPIACDAGVLLTQTAGEYQARAADAGLELVVSCPPVPVPILADSRLQQRVMDNLMNNVCKYALPGTRVYLDLQVRDGRALLSFKNISRSALNISADELLERFVRGDEARSTSGHGLGLSIARSLTELQGGRLELTVDGDLFKVTLSYPILEG